MKAGWLNTFLRSSVAIMCWMWRVVYHQSNITCYSSVPEHNWWCCRFFNSFIFLRSSFLCSFTESIKRQSLFLNGVGQQQLAFFTQRSVRVAVKKNCCDGAFDFFTPNKPTYLRVSKPKCFDYLNHTCRESLIKMLKFHQIHYYPRLHLH